MSFDSCLAREISSVFLFVSTHFVFTLTKRKKYFFFFNGLMPKKKGLLRIGPFQIENSCSLHFFPCFATYRIDIVQDFPDLLLNRV